MRLDKIRANKESGENMYLLSGNPNLYSFSEIKQNFIPKNPQFFYSYLHQKNL